MNHRKMIGKTRLDYVAKKRKKKCLVESDKGMINIVVRAMKENEKNKLLIYHFVIGMQSKKEKRIHPT